MIGGLKQTRVGGGSVGGWECGRESGCDGRIVHELNGAGCQQDRQQAAGSQTDKEEDAFAHRFAVQYSPTGVARGRSVSWVVGWDRAHGLMGRGRGIVPGAGEVSR